MMKVTSIESNLERAEGFWLLPEDWKWIPLNEIAPRDLKTAKPANTPDEVISYLGLEDIAQGQGSDVRYQQVLGRKIKSSCIKFNESHVLYAKLRPYLNKVVVPNLKGFGSTEWVPFQPIATRLARKYLAWFLRCPAFVSYASRNVAGARMPRVRMEVLLNAPVPIPFPDDTTRSLNIQHQIVARIEARLSEVQESRNLLCQIHRDTEDLLAVALSEVFTKNQSVTDIVPLSEVATAFNGKAVGDGNSHIRVFKSKHVYPHSLRLDKPSYMKVEQVAKMPENRFLKPSDVLMANAAEGTLGRVTYVHQCKENWTVDGKIMILRSLDEQNLLLNKWLYYYLWSNRGRREVLSRRTGTAFADNRGQTGISPTSVLEIPVPKPPINQQQQAVAYLDSIQQEAEAMLKLLDRDAQLLNQLEQSILERAFRGEL